MGTIVSDYTNKKVVDYLNTGNYKNVLFKFHHGLGDAVMWQPLFKHLRTLYPNIIIQQHLHLGQEDLFESSPTDDPKLFDIVFEIAFHLNDHVCDKYTKAEYCCVRELGIEPIRDTVRIRSILPSPLVGVHFFSTCVPSAYGCPENIARKIWDKILDHGLIPLDTHMKHRFNNPANKHFTWNTCSIDIANADVINLVGVLQRCAGFCGVASGNFNLATSLFDHNKLLYIKNKSPREHISKLDILSIDVHNYDSGVVSEWLNRVKENI